MNWEFYNYLIHLKKHIMKKFVTLLYSLFYFQLLLGQGYTDRIYSDPGFRRGVDIQKTLDGGLILLGQAYDPSLDFDSIVCTKTDLWGNIEWTKIFGGEFIDWDGSRLIPTLDSGYVIFGSGMGPTGASPLVKLNSNGDTILCKDLFVFGGCYFTDGAQTPDSGFIMLNQQFSTLVKLNSNADTIWTSQCYPNMPTSYGSAMSLLSNGVIVAGVRDSLVLLCKTDLSGQVIWQKEWQVGNHPYPVTVAETSEDGFIIMGPTLDTTQWYTMLVKTDAAGDTLWTKKHPHLNSFFTRGIITPDNGYMIATLTDTSSHAVAIKFDSLGNVQSTFQFGNSSDAVSLTMIDSSNFAIVGQSFSSGVNLYFARTGVQTSIENIAKEQDVFLYPNPSENLVHIHGNVQGCVLKLYDAVGKEVFNKKLVDGEDIKLNQLTPGVYFYTITNFENSTFISKGSFIKTTK